MAVVAVAGRDAQAAATALLLVAAGALQLRRYFAVTAIEEACQNEHECEGRPPHA